MVCLAGVTAAQDTPKPAPELQKLAPLIGSWQGSGTAVMGPGEPSKWESSSTYSWALGNFFVQEDTTVRFSGMPNALVMRSYLGWDAQNERYVAVVADNDGDVSVDRVELAADGSIVQLDHGFHDGHGFTERYTTKVDGDSMQFSIALLMAEGTPMEAAKGTMRRVDEAAPAAMDASSFTAAPNPAIVQLGKSAGTYAVKATMVMMPGTPAMNISGKDVVTRLFGGTLVHVHTTGTAEGMPDAYEGQLFYGWDAERSCIKAVMVSNMGEVAEMYGKLTPDHQQFVLASTAEYMGQLCSQRTIMDFDPDGAVVKAVGHCLMGTAAPFESWNATYTKS